MRKWQVICGALITGICAIIAAIIIEPDPTPVPTPVPTPIPDQKIKPRCILGIGLFKSTNHSITFKTKLV